MKKKTTSPPLILASPGPSVGITPRSFGRPLYMSAALELEILHGKFGSVTTIHRVTGSENGLSSGPGQFRACTRDSEYRRLFED